MADTLKFLRLHFISFPFIIVKRISIDREYRATMAEENLIGC